MSRPLPALGAARPLPPITLHAHALSNGLALSVVERRELPIVHLEIILHGGAELDPPITAGRLSMMAEMLDEGTPARGALDIAEQLDHLGAYFSVQPVWDATILSLQVVSSRLEPALDIVADVVLNAVFPAGEFRRKQKERLTALLQERDDPALLAGKALAADVFGAAHPFGAPIDGTHDSVARLTRDDVAALYATQGVARNAHVLVVGDVDRDAVARAIDARFGGWPAGQPAPVRMPALPRANGRKLLLVDKPGAAQAELRVGQTAPARTTDDYV
ncbi:MAG: M16 family metallopeptidase, partial [Gemmatimonadota bacterium]